MCKHVDIEKLVLIDAATYGHPRSAWKNSFSRKNAFFQHLAPLNTKIIFPKKNGSNVYGGLNKYVN